MSDIAGSLYPAGSSAGRPARLKTLDDGRVSIESDGKQQFCAGFDELDVSARLGNTPRYVNLPHGGRFETVDNDSIDALLRRFDQGFWRRLLHRLESHLVLVIVMLLAVVLFVWGSVRYAVPAVASVSADALPVEVVRYIGKGTLEILDKTMFEPSALPPDRKDQLGALFLRYTNQYPDLAIRVEFRHGGDIGANAMALPDGYIIFTDELVELAEDDLELVAILGHEIGHLQRRHLLRHMIQSSMVTVLLVLITGDVSSASSLVYAMPALLLELSYSRAFEVEADDFAYRFMREREIPPHHFADIMLRLLGDEAGHESGRPGVEKGEDMGVAAYFSTHPDTRLRIERFIGD